MGTLDKEEETIKCRASSFAANCYFENEEEFNLVRLFKKIIIQAFKRYPKDTNKEIAAKLGISERSLTRFTDIHNLRDIRDSIRQQAKQKSKKK